MPILHITDEIVKLSPASGSLSHNLFVPKQPLFFSRQFNFDTNVQANELNVQYQVSLSSLANFGDLQTLTIDTTLMLAELIVSTGAGAQETLIIKPGHRVTIPVLSVPGQILIFSISNITQINSVNYGVANVLFKNWVEPYSDYESYEWNYHQSIEVLSNAVGTVTLTDNSSALDGVRLQRLSIMAFGEPGTLPIADSIFSVGILDSNSNVGLYQTAYQVTTAGLIIPPAVDSPLLNLNLLGVLNATTGTTSYAVSVQNNTDFTIYAFLYFDRRCDQ